MEEYKKRFKSGLPYGFNQDIMNTIERIEENHSVIGVMYIHNGAPEMYSVPEIMAQGLITKLPILNEAMHHAVTELIIKMKILSNLLKDANDESLVKITSIINNKNPIVDRLMEDDSVEGVVMTNKGGAPILTNMSLIKASNYGYQFNKYCIMVQNYMQELVLNDSLDKVVAVRVMTAKKEIIVTPDKEFNIIVLQQRRIKNNKSEIMEGGKF